MATSAIEKKPFENDAFGFPRGRTRRIRPVALACIHITGNKRTAKMDKREPGTGCLAEWEFASRADSTGPSAHLYVARDGSAIQAISPRRFAAWSNGDVSSPNLRNDGVRKAVAFRNKGYNTNEAYWEEIECVGASRFPLTDAQIETCARRIARRSKVTGLPISRETVHGHWEINGIDRQNCPAPRGVHVQKLQTIIARALELGDAMEQRVVAKESTGRGGGGLPFGADRSSRGRYVVLPDVARQRSSPFVRRGNIVGRLQRGEVFRVRMSTSEGSRVGGSSRWHGNEDGTVWMHDSVIAREGDD